ncbi:MAG: hypothetical protein JNJ69_08460 [Leptospiraceae bacterium]|nr:hypothetical protein [Leptospiraceae bacterium]
MYNLRLVKFAVLAGLMLSGACKPKPLKLTLAHNSAQTAFDLPIDTVVQGAISTGESVVFLRVRLAQPQMLRAELPAVRAVDSSITVFHPGERELFTIDDNGSSLPEEIYPVLLPAGDTLLRLRFRAEEPAEFRFFYRVFNPPSDTEREPNNTPETANAITGMHATGFHGPVYAFADKEKNRERDCFSKSPATNDAVLVSAKLTGVEGVTGAVSFHDAAGKEIHREEAGSAGAALETSPVFVAAGTSFIICVASARPVPPSSRDYYDLTLSFSDLSHRGEAEPNNRPENASRITADSLTGQISTQQDVDYLVWVNKRDYPVIVNATLESPQVAVLRLEAVRKDDVALVFEDSAVAQEVAENIRVEAGEQLLLALRVRPKLRKKDFKPAAYTVKINESQFNDDSEFENNGNAARADTLVDHAQKWGFINPPGDVDFYRLKVDAPVERQLVFESKIPCKVRLEHLRAGKTIAGNTALSNVKYSALFEKDDLVRVQCVGQKPNPPERAYRLALVEP